MSSQPQYELVYFDGRGAAETSRLLFAYSGTSFTDTRVTFEAWPTTDGPNVKSKTPFGKLPLLRVKNAADTPLLELPQSRSIERYLAKKFGLYGKTAEEAGLIDAFVDQVQEVRNAIANAKGDEQNTNVIENELPTHFANMAKWISSHSKSGTVVGDSVSWADIALFAFVNSSQSSANAWYNKAAAKAAQQPALMAVVERVGKIEKIAAYVATRKATAW